MSELSEITTVETPSTDSVPVLDMTSQVTRLMTLALIGSLAVLGNLLVISVVMKYRKLQIPTNVFVCNLSLTGIIIGISLLILMSNVLKDRNTLGTAGCTVWGITAIISYVVDSITYALISLNRYTLIAHPQQYTKVFTTATCVLYSAVTWIVGLLVGLGTVIGWTSIEYFYKSKCCSYSRTTGLSYHYFLLSTCFGIPLATSFVFYLLLYATVRRSARRSRTSPSEVGTGDISHGGKLSGQVAPRESNVETSRRSCWKLTRMLAITFVVYLACLGPYAAVNIIDVYGRLPEVVHILVSWLLFSNVAINPFVYGAMNKAFRDAYVDVLFRNSNQCLKCKDETTPNI